MPRLFGTDGVRGVVNRDLTVDLALQLARAAALATDWDDRPRTVLIGRDTRRSGEMFEAALTAGFTSMGLNVLPAGVLPTAAIAYLTRSAGAGLGVVISASHNPADDNGIKFLAGDGTKLSAAQEDAIEKQLGAAHPPAGPVGRVLPHRDGAGEYGRFLQTCCPEGLAGLRIVADFAHGAAYQVGPEVFRVLGAELTALNATPDGRNINAGCGSLHPEVAAEATRAAGADAGVTLDGDADRCLLADASGTVVDGDQVLGLLAAGGAAASEVPVVVGTVMSNLGLEQALAAGGIRLERAPVGDRFVWERMVATGAMLGGEPSGHIILRQYTTTGDGLLTALRVLGTMKRTGQTLADLAACVQKVPQVLQSVRVRDRDGWDANPRVRRAIQQAEAALDGTGRLLVRASGTEPLIRIMIEGADRERIEALAAGLGQVIAQELGGP